MKTRLAMAGILVVGAASFGCGYFLRDNEAVVDLSRADARREGLEGRLATLEAELEGIRREHFDARHELDGLRLKESMELGELRVKLKDAEARIARLAEESLPKADRGAESIPLRGSLVEMMRDPGFREMAKRQQLATVDMQYGGLFGRLNLSGKEREDFKALLGDKLMEGWDLKMELASLAATKEGAPGKIAELSAELKMKEASVDQKIRAYLGNEADYETFKNWEDTRPERMMLTVGSNAFSGVGEPLSREQEEQLVGVMFEARKSLGLGDSGRPFGPDFQNVDANAAGEILQKWDEQASRVVERAGGFLSARQLEALQTIQQGHRSMQEMGLKMSSGIFGGKK